ncbi:MAG: hypothetical protein HQL93_04195 [Magnetococcales bacterium]|nr:hypothetical protein [Magnetococcales bacterium]
MRIEGLPDVRNDFGIAQIAQLIVSSFGGEGTKLTIGDFMPWTKIPKTEPVDDIDDAEKRSQQIMALLGG